MRADRIGGAGGQDQADLPVQHFFPRSEQDGQGFLPDHVALVSDDDRNPGPCCQQGQDPGRVRRLQMDQVGLHPGQGLAQGGREVQFAERTPGGENESLRPGRPAPGRWEPIDAESKRPGRKRPAGPGPRPGSAREVSDPTRGRWVIFAEVADTHGCHTFLGSNHDQRFSASPEAPGPFRVELSLAWWLWRVTTPFPFREVGLGRSHCRPWDRPPRRSIVFLRR